MSRTGLRGTKFAEGTGEWAYYHMQTALRLGHLQRPEACQECGAKGENPRTPKTPPGGGRL